MSLLAGTPVHPTSRVVRASLFVAKCLAIVFLLRDPRPITVITRRTLEHRPPDLPAGRRANLLSLAR